MQGAIEDFMKMIHTVAAPVIERERMTDDQAVNFMMAVMWRGLDQIAADKPELAERIADAFARDLAAQADAER